MDDQRWQRVQEIFHAALDHPAADRAAYVDQACAEDVALHGAVTALLANHDRADGFLSPPPGPADSNAIQSVYWQGFAPGRRVGPYILEREIGRGGMGVVYLGVDTRLDRQVALKTLAPGLVPDDRRGERLKIEARAAASLVHPAIATVFALEELDGGVWIVSEYVPGETLRELLRRQQRLAIDPLLNIACQTADGLHAAHERGIVHRDFKPENVIVTSDGRAKILDFGLARLLTDGGHHRLTREGAIVGTLAYMAPEQLQGRDVDFAADLFAFGVVLHELACGGHPYSDSGTETTLGALLQAGPPPLPADVDPRLAPIIRRCLQPDPRKRYARTSDLVDDLARLKERRPESGQRRGARIAETTDPSQRQATALWWWRFHQFAIASVYASVLYPVWTLRDAGPWQAGSIAFLLLLALVVVVASLRINLWFTSRVHADGLQRQRARLRRVLPVTDWATATLLFGLGLTAAAIHPARSALLVGVGVASFVSSLLIEPATAEAAFPTSPRRVTPRRRSPRES